MKTSTVRAPVRALATSTVIAAVFAGSEIARTDQGAVPAHVRRDADGLKQDVARWYEAFNKKDPALLDGLLSEHWVDIPPAPGQLPGRQGAKDLLVQLTAAFPDLAIEIEDVLRDGSKVIVRSEISGTQRGPFMGRPGQDRRMRIQAIDIHEFTDGRIVRTWHTEDWLSGLHQLGVLAE
jgi:steroid delta-isomerase-like uncharacterized protein